jgi:nitrite reductase/ring-hydroxylating ferredoxin subunit
MDEDGRWMRVGEVGEVARGAMKAVSAAGYHLALYHLDDGTWCASENICTHAAARLTDGWLEGWIVECPLHGGRFDLRSGAGLGAPIEEDLALFPVRVENGAVLVQLPEE